MLAQQNRDLFFKIENLSQSRHAQSCPDRHLMGTRLLCARSLLASHLRTNRCQSHNLHCGQTHCDCSLVLGRCKKKNLTLRCL